MASATRIARGWGVGLLVVGLLGWRAADVGGSRRRLDRSLWTIAPLFVLTLTFAFALTALRWRGLTIWPLLRTVQHSHTTAPEPRHAA